MEGRTGRLEESSNGTGVPALDFRTPGLGGAFGLEEELCQHVGAQARIRITWW